jgi:molybdopterin molybdotransferase
MNAEPLACTQVIERLASCFKTMPWWPSQARELSLPGVIVLNEPVISPRDWPPQDLSAMDGVAFPWEDALMRSGEPNRFTLVGSAVPGHPYQGTLSQGQAIRIATGAALPRGANSVCPTEDAVFQGSMVHLPSPIESGQHVRRAGEDIRAGDPVCGPGLLTLGQRMALCALGVKSVSAKAPLRIATLGIGSEFGSSDGLFDANQPTIHQLMQAWPAILGDHGLCEDDPARIAAAVAALATKHDLIFTTGAMADGQSDHWVAAMQGIGVASRFTVAMRPGRKLGLARVGDCVVVGLPGTPSAMLSMLIAVVEPALAACCEVASGFRQPSAARLAHDWPKPSGRTEVHRVAIDAARPGWVHSAGRMAPSLLQPWTTTNALMILAHDQTTLRAGDEVLIWAL